MRHRTLSLCLVLLGATGLLLASPAHAQRSDAHAFFEQGNALYEEGRYEEALLRYEQARTSGYVSGALYHNMGNAYFRLDSLGQAIRYYERARRLLPGDRHLRHNLAIARSRTADDFPRSPTPFWEPWWHRLTAHVGAWGFFAAGFVLCCLGAGLLAHRIWTGTQAPWRRRAMVAILLLGVLLLGTAFAASLEPRLTRRAVILAETAPLRERPDASAAPTLTLHEGTVVDVRTARADWLQVELPDGTTGWITAPATAEI